MLATTLTPDDTPLTATSGCVVTVSITSNSETNTLNLLLGADQAAPWLEHALLNRPPGTVIQTTHAATSTPIQLHLHDITPPPTSPLPPNPTPADYLSQADQLREQANGLFKESDGKYQQLRSAIVTYNRALDMLRLAGGDADLELRLRNNLALCYFRAREWAPCVAMCDAVLEKNPQCAKAFYRRGLATVELDWIVRGLADLRQARKLAPEDDVIRKELNRIEGESKRVLLKRRDQFAETYSCKPQSSIYSEPIPE